MGPGTGIVADRAKRAAETADQKRCETALNAEMAEHLGYEKHDPPGAGTGNIRSGTRAKTLLTDTTSAVEVDVARDRAATFEAADRQQAPTPTVRSRRGRAVAVCQRLTTGEISAHFVEIYSASVSKETISRITDKVLEEMNYWPVLPLDETYAAIFIDPMVAKVRDSQVANRPFYAAIRRDVGRRTRHPGVVGRHQR